MAPKRPSPMEDPPVASSSEEEEEDEVSSEEEEAQNEDYLSEEEEEDEDGDEETPPVKMPISKESESADLPISTAIQPQPSDSDSGSETDTDSDSAPERTLPIAKSETVAARSLQENLETEKPKASNSLASPMKSIGKPPMVKRAKTNSVVASEDEKKPGEDTKKQYFHRLWSENDELAVLKGMLNYKSETGVSPYDSMSGFYDFIKKSISFDVSKIQLMDKIRALKKKYVNNLSKGKNGGGKAFSKPHDQKSFDLSKSIWGTEASILDSAMKTNGKSKMNIRGKSKSLDSLKQELFSLPNGKKETDGFETTNLRIEGSEMIPIDKIMSDYGVDEVVARQGWDMVSLEDKKVIEEKWKKLRIKSMDVHVQRTEFMNEAARLISEAFRGSDH